MASLLERFRAAWQQDPTVDFNDPAVSLSGPDLSGLPPTTVHRGEYEILAPTTASRWAIASPGDGARFTGHADAGSAPKAAEALAARMCTGPWQQALGFLVSPPRRSAA
ncbi:hypothetical protein ACFYRJ_36380 [Streptomyces sp. NPDC005531]|uniref:hypothetical protein n=1 Tax=Streptomyces sp. NPDC005531 TaxID=3364722 RepID=UPI0036A4F3CA